MIWELQRALLPVAVLPSQFFLHFVFDVSLSGHLNLWLASFCSCDACNSDTVRREEHLCAGIVFSSSMHLATP